MKDTQKRSFPRWAAIIAVAIGIGGGSYGIAAAASGTTAAETTPAAATQSAAPSRPWGGQRSDETVLTGDNLSNVSAAAQAKVPGGTIIRVETDADGNAAYEAHMTDASGTPVTVYLDKSFSVVSVESR
jgi:hypothetical protein